jgi:hypothetical protein
MMGVNDEDAWKFLQLPVSSGINLSPDGDGRRPRASFLSPDQLVAVAETMN